MQKFPSDIIRINVCEWRLEGERRKGGDRRERELNTYDPRFRQVGRPTYFLPVGKQPSGNHDPKYDLIALQNDLDGERPKAI